VVAVLVGGCRIGFDEVAAGGGDAGADGNDLTYRAAVLADSPVAYWRLDDTDTDTTARDETGHVDGTYVGGCQRGVAGALAGDTDPAAQFDGSTCQITLGNNFNFAGNAPFSVELWVDVAASTAYEHYFTYETRTGPASGAPIDGYALFRDNGPTGVMVERAVDGSGLKTTPVTIAADRWSYLVLVYTGTQQQLYVDGTLAETLDDARPLSAVSTVALIGAHSQGAFLSGDLDEVAVYDAVLPPDRIALHHELGRNGPMASTGP